MENGYMNLGIMIHNASTGERDVRRLVWKWFINMEGWEEALQRKLFYFCKKGGLSRIEFDVYDVESGELIYEFGDS